MEETHKGRNVNVRGGRDKGCGILAMEFGKHFDLDLCCGIISGFLQIEFPLAFTTLIAI
jgi:hypothetical protein